MLHEIIDANTIKLYQMKQTYKKLRAMVTLVLFCMCPALLWAQTKISGTVTDENKQSLPGVSVRINGSNQGVTTDVEGRYLLNVNSGQTITFTFLGYATQSVVVTNQTVINVSLKPDSKSR